MTVGFLDQEVFRDVVCNAPLVSIDLVVRNELGEVLLGQRVKPPAQGFWFVPGGRILKNETLAEAFLRVTAAELGCLFSISNAQYLGLYEHFYPDSVFGCDISTHYVVNCFQLVLPLGQSTFPEDQHQAYQWFSESALLEDPLVHLHTKWYFQPGQGVGV